MFVRPLRTSRKGFTLIEMIISMTIFAMMSVIVMSVYFQVTDTSRRLNAERQLAETAREIVERIGADISTYGFSGSAQNFTDAYPLWGASNYTDSGSEVLNLSNGRYVYGAKKEGGMEPCILEKKSDPKMHCGLYFVSYTDNGAQGYNLVDSFVPEESKKRVKIEDLKFYVSGDGISTGYKVTLNYTLSLIPRIGVTSSLVNQTRLHIQTTLSERPWKQ